MMHDRRSLLAAMGLAVPFALDLRAGVSAQPTGPAPLIRLRPFAEAVREAFGLLGRVWAVEPVGPGGAFPCRRIEVGYSEAVQAGLQGCYNDRPFAGYPAGYLRIVRTGGGPGAVVGGVRLYVATVDVALTGGREVGGPGRPFDFASLPPAPILLGAGEDLPRPRLG